MIVVICDEDQTHRQKLHSYLNAIDKKRTLFHVKEYENGKKLLADIKKGALFDIVFIDVGLNNLNVIKEIRAADHNLLIIFTADYQDQVTYAFEVEAFHYLTKPVSFQTFSNTLERAYRKCYEKKKMFMIEWKKQIKAILLKSIVYVECYNRHIVVQTDTELLESSQPFREMVETLIPAGFIRVHHSFLVNPAHINEINNRELICTNGLVIPVSIRREKEVVEQFRSYLQKCSV